MNQNEQNKENDFCSSNFLSENHRPQNSSTNKPIKKLSKEHNSTSEMSVKFTKKTKPERNISTNTNSPFDNVVIPSNLKMKDEHLPYFCDLQNVLI